MLAASACGDSGTGPGAASPLKLNGEVVAWDGSDAAGEGLLSAAAFQGGDTLRFWIDAQDSLGLKWVGLIVQGVPDSAEVPPALATQLVRLSGGLVLSYGYTGELDLQMFAVDRYGHRVSSTLPGSPAWIYRTVPMPVRQSTFETNYVGHFRFDAARNHLYYAQSESDEIGDFDIGQMTQAPPIALPALGGDVDETLDGSDLLVPLPTRHSLAIIPIDTPTTVHERPMDEFTPDSMTPRTLRMAANGHVLVALAPSGAIGLVGRLLDYDLANGTGELLPSAGIGGLTADDVPIIASTTRQHLLAFTLGRSKVQEYETSTGLLGPISETLDYPTQWSIDSVGDEYLVEEEWFTRAAGFQHAYLPPGYAVGAGGTAIATEGGIAYFCASDGFVRIRLEDGRVYDRVVTGWRPQSIIPLPGTRNLLLVTSEHIAEVNLSALPSAPPERSPAVPGAPIAGHVIWSLAPRHPGYH
ncbi:MAG TPA: hypothetical protein VJN95_10950 [Gemmatimonadales bacterium]|nr:hypothetical protein [Gemmatimonadales bacterium]